jgi:hypothetical protein
MFACLLDRDCGIDQADVGKGLREVAKRRTGGGIDLFGEQAQVVGEREHMIE